MTFYKQWLTLPTPPPALFWKSSGIFSPKMPPKYTECKCFVVGKGQIYQNLRTSASLTFRIIYLTDIDLIYLLVSKTPSSSNICHPEKDVRIWPDVISVKDNRQMKTNAPSSCEYPPYPSLPQFLSDSCSHSLDHSEICILLAYN